MNEPAGTHPVYLDYAATTPVDPRVAALMQECLTAEGDFGNPASLTHAYGRRAARHVAEARAQVAALVGCEPDEVVFTSGATEANNLALFGAAHAPAGQGRHLVSARTEHRAVLDPLRQLEREGFEVSWVVPGADGRIEAADVSALMRSDTRIVSIMHVNNETGVVNDIAAIGAACRDRGVLFHSDAAQSAGRLALDLRTLPVDLLSLSAHKLYGPKGIGALIVRAAARARLAPLHFGGGQERGLRAGTLATHQIAGFGAAATLTAAERATETLRIDALCERLWGALRALGGVHLNGAGALRAAGFLNASFEGVQGESLVSALPELALSRGSACSTASGEPSHVLRALGRSAELAQSSLRVSLGRFTTPRHIEVAAAAIARELLRLRTLAGSAVEARVPEETPDEPMPDLPAGLSPLAWRYFRASTTVGRLEGAGVIRGEAGREADGARVQFFLRVARDFVTEARFLAYGCPHTLAAAAWLAEQLPGRARQALIPGQPEIWAATLGVPIEKLGRMLTVEDALQDCLRRWSPRA